MIKKKSKILLILIIFVMTFNFCSPVVMADDMAIDPDNYGQVMNDAQQMQNGNVLGSVVDWGAGILFYPIKMIAYFFGKAIHLITETVAGDGKDVTPDTILFNDLAITNINFFDSENNDVAFVKSLKENVASWYYTMRNIAIIASLAILLYIGIRMAMSTVASDKAEYKRMLIDWAVGFALIFVLHYIIILVITGNNLIVDILEKTVNTGDGSQITTFVNQLEDQVWDHVDFSQSLGAIFVYLIFVIITLAFLIMYIKRMIVVAFLIIIAPLITITYAIDKVGDSKSQALDAWLKEFFWTILIQPFHCVIYVVFVSISLTGLDASSLSGSVLAIMCMVFILQAEDIIKKIFGIQADNIGKMSSSFVLAAGGMIAAKKLADKSAGAAGKGASKAVTAVGKYMPKTENGKGIGIGETDENRPNSFSQKVANFVADDRVQKRMKQFNNFMEDKKIANFAGKVVNKYATTGYNMASGITGVATSLPNAKGLSDVVDGAFTGLAAGYALKAGGKYLGKKATVDVVEAGRTRNAQINLNDSYAKMKQETGLDDEQMKEKIKGYLKLDLSSAVAEDLNATERLFAYNVQVMKSQLEKAGKDGSADSVISKIKMKDNADSGDNGSNSTKS